MLDGTLEVLVSRSPFLVAVLAVVTVVGLAACGDGGSGRADKPRRPTTTTSTSTTTSTVPGGATGSTSTTAPGTPPTIPPESVGTCGNQTDAIVAAITGSDVGGLDQNAGQYTVKQCRIAASSPIWAAAVTVPSPGVQLDRATVVLQRIGALWNVEQVGTSNVGCNAPAAVKVDLGLVCSG